MPRTAYGKSVFINCPFDPDYTPLFRALVFTVIRCGFYPRCTLEESDSSEVRVHKIFRMISECKYGVHDLSRTESSRKTGPRFNMPFELGVFLATKHYGSGEQANKRCLVLERTPHSYESFISDIKGQDVSAHHDKPRAIVRAVRDWLSTNSARTRLHGHNVMWKEFELAPVP